MTQVQPAEAHHARPFRPFRLKISEGGVSEVNHPERLARSGRALLLAFLGKDSFAAPDLMMVAAIEVGEQRGGKRRRRAD